mgnify:FL=1
MAAADRAVTLKQFARLLDVSPGYVTELKQAGRLVLDAAGRVQVDASKARIAETADPAKDGVRARHAAARDGGGDHHPHPASGGHSGADSAPGSVGSTYQASRAVKERYLALDAKRAYEEAIGKLVDIATVEMALKQAATRCRLRLESLGAVLGPALVMVTDEAVARERIDDAVEHALSDLSRELTAITHPETT